MFVCVSNVLCLCYLSQTPLIPVLDVEIQLFRGVAFMTLFFFFFFFKFVSSQSPVASLHRRHRDNKYSVERLLALFPVCISAPISGRLEVFVLGRTELY